MTSPSALDVVGLVPAAGAATRLGPIPCSKAILPVAGAGPGSGGVRVACHSLLESLAVAGITRCLVVVDTDTGGDVPRFLGDGEELGLDLGYLTVSASPSTVATLDRARRHVGDATVVLGFPDIQLAPLDVVTRVLEHHRASGADVVLGLMRATDPTAVDVVDVDELGIVHAVVPKPRETTWPWMWVLAVWGPRFTALLHEHAVGAAGQAAREPFVGDVVAAAITAGMRVEGVRLEDGRYHDIGTPATLAAAQRGLAW